MENLYIKDCIRTVSGIYVNVFEPTPEMFIIEDIAHALSMQCRFSGHLPKFYSVSQHSVSCSLIAGNQLEALLHDASEAYLLDIPSPIKAHLADYKKIEHKVMECIASKFNFQYPLSEDTHQKDKFMLEYEWNNIMLKGAIEVDCWDSNSAKAHFLARYHELTQ